MIDVYFKQKENLWECLCRRCGACCGAFDDPCKHLEKNEQNRYYCEIYPNRLGVRETVKGEKFDCVPLKEIIHNSWVNDWQCAYKLHLKLPWLQTGR